MLASCLLIWLTAVPTARADQGSPAADSAPRAIEADREQLRQIMVERRIESTSRQPGLSLYMRDAALAFSRWMAGVLELLMPRFSRLLAGSWAEPLLKLLLALLAMLLLAYLVPFVVRRWLRRQVAEQQPVWELPEDDSPDPLDPRWEAELRQRLERGEIAAAIEALWWWLARRLVGADAEPSWTSRELITRADRRDLMPSVRRLDRMIYAEGQPSADDVSNLWHDLREAVG